MIYHHDVCVVPVGCIAMVLRHSTFRIFGRVMMIIPDYEYHHIVLHKEIGLMCIFFQISRGGEPRHFQLNGLAVVVSWLWEDWLPSSLSYAPSVASASDSRLESKQVDFSMIERRLG